MIGKRGQEQLLMHIFYMIFIAFILAAMIYFASNVAKGEGIKKRVMAKQIALLLDAAEPKTAITLSNETFISKEGSKIMAGKENPFSYSFFNPFTVNFAIEEKRIEILEKSKK